MKKYFAVSFKYSESVYCSNIAHAETAEAVEAHYSKYEWSASESAKITKSKPLAVRVCRL